MSRKNLSAYQNKDEPEMEEIKRGFDLFDVKGTGKIDPEEMKTIMEETNLKEKNPFIYEIISSFATPEVQEEGGITFEQYFDAIKEKMTDDKTKEGIRRLFEFYCDDPEATSIPLAVFVKVAKELHEDKTEEELKDMLAKSEFSGEELTFDEFYEIMTNKISTK